MSQQDHMPDRYQRRWQELPAAALAHTLTFIPNKRSDVKLVCRDWRRAVNESITSATLPCKGLDVLQHMPCVRHLTVRELPLVIRPRGQADTAPSDSNPWAKTGPGTLQRLQSLDMFYCPQALLDLASWQQQQQQAVVAQVPTSRTMSHHGQQANNQDAEGCCPGWRLHMLQSLSLHGMKPSPIADALSLLLVAQEMEGNAHGSGGSAAAATAAVAAAAAASSDCRASSSSAELRAAPLQHLTRLQLQNCCLSQTCSPIVADGSLPTLQHLPSLADLSVTGCDLVRVSQAVCGCSGLTQLQLSNNLISGQLPAKFSQLQKLQVLDLSYNGNLHSLGPGFSRLGSLTELRLSGFNALFKQRRPADGPGSTDDTLVGWQVASHEQQQQALPELRHLQALRKLFLDSNRDIRELPTVLSALTGLQVLDARGCSIRHLGDALWECVGLQQLLLEDNVLDHLPASISKLQDLEVLNLAHCDHLWQLPQELSTLRKLRELQVSNLAIDHHLLGQLQLRNPNPVEVVLDTDDDEFEDEDDEMAYMQYLDECDYLDEFGECSEWDSDVMDYPF